MRVLNGQVGYDMFFRNSLDTESNIAKHEKTPGKKIKIEATE